MRILWRDDERDGVIDATDRFGADEVQRLGEGFCPFPDLHEPPGEVRLELEGGWAQCPRRPKDAWRIVDESQWGLDEEDVRERMDEFGRLFAIDS